MAAYSFTNNQIVQELAMSLEKGVKLSIVMDKTETHGAQARIHDTLEKRGAKIRLCKPQGGIMHNKYLVVDGQSVQWGSYNYTNRAEHYNFENVTLSLDPLLAQAYEQNFNKIWQQSTAEIHGPIRPLLRFF